MHPQNLGKMKILVTGANGLLGQHLVKILLETGHHVVATGKGPCRLLYKEKHAFIYYPINITDDEAVGTMMEKERPAVVVHAAAMTQVDECQLNQQLCEDINVKATAQLLLQAESISSHFIYISTDFVFDGEKGDYSEEDHLNPVNWYGFTKVQAESIVETSEIPWAIVRTCLVYGNTIFGTRSNIVSWVKQNLENGKAIKVVSDQWRTPTYVEDLARGILLIIQKKATGIFHISGKDKATPFDIAIATANLFKLDTSLIEKVNASTFSQPAKRPPKTGFNISKASGQLGYVPVSLAEGLRKMYESSQ